MDHISSATAAFDYTVVKKAEFFFLTSASYCSKPAYHHCSAKISYRYSSVFGSAEGLERAINALSTYIYVVSTGRRKGEHVHVRGTQSSG